MSDISLESVTAMALDDRDLARSLGKPAAAVAGSRLVAEMHGIMKGGISAGVQVTINLFGSSGSPDASAVAGSAIKVDESDVIEAEAIEVDEDQPES